MLWVALCFPTLPLDVYARAWRDEDAARRFVVASAGRVPRVVAANGAARAAGIRRDLAISAALALAPDIVLRERDSAAEAEALDDLATLVLQFTPQACLVAPDAIVAEVGTSARLFGGLPRLLSRLTDSLRAQHYALATSLAPTPTAALLLARAGRDMLVRDPRELPEALRPLPLALCDVDPAALATLAAAGVTNFGEAAALPRDALARRCGSALVAMLDRALARAADPRVPFAPPPKFARRLELPAPVADVEALAFALNRLVHELAAWLTARGLGALRLTLTLAHEHYLKRRGVTPTEVPLNLGAPARAVAHLNGVLRERLARVALPAPVEALTLATAETAPLAGRNLGLLPGDDADAALVPLVDRLRARLGDDAITRVAPHAEHRPELALREATIGDRPRFPVQQSGIVVPGSPRPLWLLAEAQPLGTWLEQKPWILKDGPERIESGWWDGNDLRRDYFVAETPRGETVWIYRDHRYGADDGEWFLHGLFA
ncbi:MAG: DNA polymerase Y family protein [Casimicrobiaceae bacterium]